MRSTYIPDQRTTGCGPPTARDAAPNERDMRDMAPTGAGAAAGPLRPSVRDGCSLQCLSCTTICTTTLSALLSASDRRDLQTLAPLLLDCITAGEAHMAFMARRSEWWLRTASLLRGACARCADACDDAIRRLADEAALFLSVPLDAGLAGQLRDCADACRRCVVLCPCNDQHSPAKGPA